MGTTCEYGRIVARRSADGGRTWSEAAYLTEDTGYHTAPVPVLVHRGRIYRAFEYHPKGPWGYFEAFLFSAPEKADLLKAESWRATPRLKFPEAGRPGKHFLEGNVLLSPMGEILDILRVDNQEKAAILKLGPDGALGFERLVAFPGGAKKFTIRWDKKSKRYWTLANQALAEYAESAEKPASVRNTLVLMSSKDLGEWRVERRVLHHPEVKYHAFQYVDWQFEGRDLVVASRTAFDDEAGGAARAHDANYLTFHRVVNFRKSDKR